MDRMIRLRDSTCQDVSNVPLQQIQSHLKRLGLSSKLDFGVAIGDTEESIDVFPENLLPLILLRKLLPQIEIEGTGRWCLYKQESEYPTISELNNQVLNKLQIAINSQSLTLYHGNLIDAHSVGVGKSWIKWVETEITPYLINATVVVPAGQYPGGQCIIYRNSHAEDPLCPSFHKDLVQFAWSKPPDAI